MARYIVGCYSPPSALKIKPGDKVKVEGWMQKEKIRAESIENLTESGPSCRCGTPKVMELIIGIPGWVEKTGIVDRVTMTSDSIEFELEAP